jgi:uncharacterized membrane protein YfhO
MGYLDSDVDINNYKINLAFQNNGDYEIKDIAVHIRHTTSLDSGLRTLAANTALNLTSYENGHIAGTIDMTGRDDGIMFLSIPYSPGFTARVNGVEVEILKSNIGFMGIHLAGGAEYIIEVSYRTPYFIEGLIVSFVMLVIIGGGWLISVALNKSKRKLD